MNAWIMGFLVVSAVLGIRLCFMTKHPMRTACSVTISGIAAFAAVFFTTIYTGVQLAANWYTLAFSAVYGVPGVISLVVLQTMM